MCPHMQTEEVMMPRRTEEIKCKCPIASDERMDYRNLRSVKLFYDSKFETNNG